MARIFFSVLSIFIVTAAVLLIFQNFMLDEIYENTKINKIKEEFQYIAEEYISDFNNEKLDQITEDYFDYTDATIAFVSNDGKVLNEVFWKGFNSIYVDEGTKTINVIFDDLFDDIGEKRLGYDINTGDEIIIDAINVGGNNYFASSISKNGQSYNVNDVGQISELVNGSAIIHGKIKGFNVVSRESGILSYQPRLLLEEIFNILYAEDENLFEDNIQKYRFMDERSGTNYNVFFKNIHINGEQILITSLFGLENISRVYKIVNPFYVRFFEIMFVILVIVLLSFSKMFTKPMIILSDQAKEIASLNFENKNNVKNQDEIGELADNLNEISYNLCNSIKELEAANLEKAENEEKMRQMLMDLSHEFKTPLGIISGFVEVLDNNIGDKPSGYYLKAINEEVEGLDHLVRQTLELTRLESKGYKLNKTSLNLESLIENMVSKFQNDIDIKNMSLDLELFDYFILADESKMKQVITNILSNAIKYSDNGANIKVFMEDKSDSIMTRFINDKAQIDKSKVHRIWDRYYRLDESHNSSVAGHGLGLSIVKNVLKLHNYEYGINTTESGFEIYFEVPKR